MNRPAVRSGASGLYSFSMPMQKESSCVPAKTSFQAPMKAVEAVAQAFSTLNMGTRSGNSPSSTRGWNSAWARIEFWPQKPMPQLPSQPDSMSAPFFMAASDSVPR